MTMEAQWQQLMARLGLESATSITWYEKLYKAYTGPGRHYHNLAHIEGLLTYIDQYEAQLKDTDALRLAVWFHDAVYQIFKNNNELQSADMAYQALQELGFDKNRTTTIHRWIAATDHRHPATEGDTDLAFLLDIDLATLAAGCETYKTYTQQVRQEYSVFPTFLYNRGRRKVLQQFLSKASIYQTPWLRDIWETPARENLQWELDNLG